MKKSVVGFGIGGLLAAAWSVVLATQIEYVTPRQMGDESALVVRGKVARVESYWNESHTKILTEALVQVDETYKGAPSSTARVVQLGGVVGDVRMHVHGALAWKTGQEVVLFLDPLRKGGYGVAGFSQGRFHVERDPVTGVAYVRRPAKEEGVEVVGAPPGAGGGPFEKSTRVPLDDFVDHALGRE